MSAESGASQLVSVVALLGAAVVTVPIFRRLGLGSVLGYLAAGHSNKVIARRLDLAESTIKVHVQNILRKLELSSRVQAAVYAVQHKVPQPD